jgi:hypothetical protein
MTPRPLSRLRKLCLALPEAIEVEAWGAPTFRVRGKLFAMFSEKGDHHSGGRHGVWIKSVHEQQQLMIRNDPSRFFYPPYTGPGGWIGVYLDEEPDWEEVGHLLRDGWRMIAPKRVVKAFDQPTTVTARPRPKRKK